MIREPARELPVMGDYDVVVAGGGPSGICAAAAAARAGARTLLVERYGFLGGTATAGWVNLLLGIRSAKTGEPVVGGICEELARRMASLGCATDFDAGLHSGRVTFEPEAFKLAADELVTGSGAELLLHALVGEVVVEDGRIRALVLEGKCGPRAATGRVFVDATGDADLVARAGARFELGRPADGRVQAMTLIVQIAGIDRARFPGRDDPAVREAMRAAQMAGLRAYRWHGAEPSPSACSDSRAFNITHLGGDPTDVADLTAAEVQGRRDAWAIADWMRREVPGMERSFLELTGHAIGVRESRRMVGLTCVTGEDVISARKREDAIARCSFGLDIHCPMAHVGAQAAAAGGFVCRTTCGKQDCPMLTEHRAELPQSGQIAGGSWYDIPYGALVCADLTNLLACGRCVSADHLAMASLRVMGPAMATGQAAGEAAAMAAAAEGEAGAVHVPELQRRLRANGAAL
ncbi:MAG: FAD-dependent oxidoreductase [Armatimonadota bacterium]